MLSTNSDRTCSLGRNLYRIVDDSGDDYVYGSSCFEIIEIDVESSSVLGKSIS